jgi:YwqJ-like deaminase
LSKINTNPDHLRRSGNKLTEFGDKISQGGQKMETAGQNLVSHASGDRSGFGAVISKAMGRGMRIGGKVFKEGGRVASKAGSHLGKTGDLHEGADLRGRSALLRHDKTAKNPHVTGSPGSTKPSSSAGGGGGGGGKKPPKLPTGGGEHGGGHEGSGSGNGKGKDRAIPSLKGDLNDPPKHTDLSSAPSSKPLGSGTKKLEQIDESRVKRGDDGLISHVDGKPVKQYLSEVAGGRANQYHDTHQADMAKKGPAQAAYQEKKAQFEADKKAYGEKVQQLKNEGRASEIGDLPKPKAPKPPKIEDSGINPNSMGPVTAASMDRRTGAIYEGVNGRPGDHATPLHPVMEQRYNDLEKRRADPNEQLHGDHPLRHAEVKATNELMWERQRAYERGELPHPPNEHTLKEMPVDNYFPFGNEVRQAPCCANCNVMLHGVPSNAGRYTKFPPDAGEFIPE